MAGLVAAVAGPASTRASTSSVAPLVALSFDDGPDSRWTPQVLDVLARYRAHATFFAVGRNAIAHPDLVRAELAAGNEVGDHTFDHADLSQLTPRAMGAEIDRGAQALEAVGAPAPRLFRPPYGHANPVVYRAAATRSYRTVLWSVSLEHFVDHAPVPMGVNELVARVRPGAVILAHDGGVPDRSRTMKALPLLLQQLEARGYRVVAVSDLLGETGRSAT
ncbi:MAG TPA: polysaccharide deacetylase family protein [Acidimicrobiales bacterium]|nr:polysaccharide deacetylase family protein [Acidimicrobiales bacterium]